jgi:hypothetical protein
MNGKNIREQPRDQHYHFVHEFLRDRVLNTPRILLDLFARGPEASARVLSTYWVMRQVPNTPPIPPDGLACIAFAINMDFRGFVITFPTPEGITEAHMAAVIVPNESASADGVSNCRYITLELTRDDHGSIGTALCEWKDGGHNNYGPGPEPTVDAFTRTVRNLIATPEKRETKALMNLDEIHDFGVEIVFTYMQKEGFEILRVNTDRSFSPQIVARKDGQRAHVTVRTACYPDKGAIESFEAASRLFEHAKAENAICYFASVGIANAEGTTDEEMSVPVRGAGFIAAFEGLQETPPF